MRLKKYQKKAIDAVSEYAKEVGASAKDPDAARMVFYRRTKANYTLIPELGAVPFTCIKIPTGGGKTLIAAHAVGSLFRDYLGERNDVGLAMWFVPSDAIRTQTLKSLRDKKHPFRQVLDARFSQAIKVLDITEAKAITKEDLVNNLCIIVATLSAFRAENTEGRKVYQENGALMDHFVDLPKDELVFLEKDKDGELVNSLVNVIKLHSPIIILDEGHNAQADNERRLGFKMIGTLNPSFVLEFTATPRAQSNVLFDVPAQALKDENMIKMPLYLENKPAWEDAIGAGVAKLKELEKAARKNKDYIRPIVLIQAEQEQFHPQRVHVDQVVEYLKNELGIATEKIAIQTGTRHQLDGIDLNDNKCPIQYIVTVYALKEGWDCPFAYILVSVSHLGARLTVEQTIGRIMRLPYVIRHKDPALNSGYIFSSTENFDEAANAVIGGLEGNGYKDLIQIPGGVGLSPKIFKRAVKDANAALPLVGIKDGKNTREIDYVEDLIGEGNVLSGKIPSVSFSGNDEQIVERIDIGHEGELIRNSVGKATLRYHVQDFTADDLTQWLSFKVQRGFISMAEMRSFLGKLVAKALKSTKVEKLSQQRYPFCEVIEKKIDSIVDKKTEKTFKALFAKKEIEITRCKFKVPKEIEILGVCPAAFKRHLFEKAGAMNGEEIVLARKLDEAKNVLWWFRNPEKSGFYIQGWKKYKIYPDFITKTKKGNYFVIEYKGQQLMGNEDTGYKIAIGKMWDKANGPNYKFWLGNGTEIPALMREILKS